jgi:hypothetical protein
VPNSLETLIVSRDLYKQRNAVGYFFSKLKHVRAVATRYDKRDDNFLTSVKLDSPRIWLRVNESMTCAIKDVNGQTLTISTRSAFQQLQEQTSKALLVVCNDISHKQRHELHNTE